MIHSVRITKLKIKVVWNIVSEMMCIFVQIIYRNNFSGIGRTLIPRYFRSIFEGGVTDLRYELRHPKESFHNTSITMDCDQCTVVTLHGKPMFTKVKLKTATSTISITWAMVVAQLAERSVRISQNPRSAVQIQSLAKFCNEHIYCLLLKKTKIKKKRRRTGH